MATIAKGICKSCAVQLIREAFPVRFAQFEYERERDSYHYKARRNEVHRRG